MEAVKAFNQELSSLYEVKPPISKAKMTALTRGAIKAIKFYKHVVQSVEKFILKCKPEYKVPGLYVIDSIVRQSRHQFGTDKDVFAPRFAKNMQQTFINLFKCPPEDKSKIIRVLNLWQKNQVFPPEVIQPLFDLADPNNPIYKEMEAAAPQQQSNGMNVGGSQSIIKGSPALQKTPTKGVPQGGDIAHGGAALQNFTDPNVIQQIQQLQRMLVKSSENRSDPVHFDKKLLDFDYGEEEEEPSPRQPPPPQPNPADSVASLLMNPEVLRQIQTLQQTMANSQHQQEIDMDKMRKLQEMKQQEDEFDKHLAQTVPNLPFAAECEFKPNNNSAMIQGYYMTQSQEVPQQQGYETSQHDQKQTQEVEVINLDQEGSQSSPEDRYRRRRSRSRSRDRRDRKRRSRSRSKSRRHRSRSREKDRKDREKDKKEKEKETEKDRERKKRGLPAIKKENLSVCSTTLWVGHLSKLVHQDDLSNTFGEFGDIVSIDLIPPRGCAFIVMHRRQDATRCLNKLKNHVLHGKAMTLAWAPGKGVKGKDLKDYWEGDLGVSYIPWGKLREDMDLELLEDGGMIDEDTMPEWMRQKVDQTNNKPTNASSAPLEPPPPFLLGDTSNQSAIDTSQPPPMNAPGLLQPPMLPMVSPFQFPNNRLLGNLGMNMMPPNIPIGVPPPNMPAPPMMSNLGMGLNSPFQGANLMAPQMGLESKPTPPLQGNPEQNMKSLSESLMGMAQPFGMLPQPPQGGLLPHHHDENMDVEMEDAEKPMMPLSEQLQQQVMMRDRRDDDRRDRDRGRRRSRSRDRGRRNSRDKDRRERDLSRSKDRRDRDRGRDRANRWGPPDRERRPGPEDERRERERNLNDRLRQMAGMAPEKDRGPRDRRSPNRRGRDNGPKGGLASEPPYNIIPEPQANEDASNPEIDRGFNFEPPKTDGVDKIENVDTKVPQETSQGASNSPKPERIPENFPLNDGPGFGSMGEPSNFPSLVEPPFGPMKDDNFGPMVDGPGFGNEGPGFGPDGPRFVPDGPGFGPDGPGFVPDGPDFGPDGPPFGPDFPNDGPGFPNDGPGFGPEGPGFGPDGPGFGPDGPRFGPDGPGFGPDGPGFRDGPGPGFEPNFGMQYDMPPDMMDGPPMGFDGPPGPGRFDRGRRGFREDRGPPGPDFYPGRDDFGPRGPPPMRGPDFGPRGPPMGGPRGPRPFFGRGRGRGGFRGDFGNPRFDGPPDFFRGGPGPRGPRPPFDDHFPRHRGPRFDDRRRGPRFDRPGPPFDRPGPPFDRPGPPFDRPFDRFDGPPRRDGPPFDRPPFDGPPFEGGGPPFDRGNKRSRWGGNDMGPEEGAPIVEEGQPPIENDGNTTPLRDELPPQENDNFPQAEVAGGGESEQVVTEPPERQEEGAAVAEQTE